MTHNAITGDRIAEPESELHHIFEVRKRVERVPPSQCGRCPRDTKYGPAICGACLDAGMVFTDEGGNDG